jgi:PAS domain S-box-containing protein
MDTIPLPVFYKNTAGNYLGCNREFEVQIGIARDDLVGKTVFDIAPVESARTYFEHDLELLERGGAQIYEQVIRFADGELHDVVLHKAVYHGMDDRPDGIVGVLVDVTEQKRWKERVESLNADLSRKAIELEAANRDLESFSYSASHDLRNPLAQISASAQLLEDAHTEPPDERYRYLVGTILESCDKMETLIDDLLNLAQTSRAEVEFSTVDLSSLAASVALDIRLAEPDRQVTIMIEPGMHAVCAPGLMRIVLENLLNNAWKYTRFTPHPAISFGSIDLEGETAYFVRDNGAGFDMARADQLFRPFQRLHDSTFPGTGIGLATVQRVVNRHGGRVWAEGVEGAGATIYFTLHPL